MSGLDYVFAAILLALVLGGFYAYRKYRAKSKTPPAGGGYGGGGNGDGGPKQPK